MASRTAALQTSRFPFFVASLALVNLACSAPESPTRACPTTTEEPLYNASVDESYLGLSAGERAAIVQVVDASGATPALCSGTLITPEWVLTAGHCLEIQPAAVIITLGSDSPPVMLDVTDAQQHSDLDLGLLRVQLDPATFATVEPIRPMSNDLELAAGDAVELAGYGLTEDATLNELRFLVEPVVSLDDEDLVVTGAGASGACLGDSGGPLLVRDGSGAPAVAGLLSEGSTSCLEQDSYVRVAAAADWIDEVAAPSPSAPADCGGIDPQGRCLYGSAIYCGPAGIVAETCDGGKRCGWDRAAAGFRCVLPVEDPCDGLDSFGACASGAASSCSEGRLERRACSCGQACRVDGKSGHPACVDQ